MREVIQRFLSLASGVPLESIRNGNLAEIKLRRLQDKGTSYFRYKNNPVILDNVYSVEDIERAVLSFPCDVVVIDYLQLLSLPGKETRAEEFGEVMRRLKMLAKRQGVLVIVLSQMNRNVELRSDKRPGLADVRGSGHIEDQSDILASLYWAYKYDHEQPANRVELTVLKNRNGRVGTVELAFNPETMNYGLFSPNSHASNTHSG